LYATLPADPTATEILLRGAVCGLGFGFFQSPNNRELIGSAPREKSASAAGLLATVRVSGQTVGAALVAIVFGVFGASVAGAAAPHDAVARAAPTVLWLACGFAGVATIASALRLRKSSVPSRAG
jgi:DHA2 family multidrug resistance protein-like MFS transporter